MLEFRTVFLAAALAAFAGSAHAVTVDIVRDDTGPAIDDDYVEDEDFFNWLKGATVSFTTSGGSVTDTWDLVPGPQCGGVAVGGFSLSGCGETKSNQWVLENESGSLLESFVVDLTTVGNNQHWFDLDLPSEGTPNSGTGREFEFASSTLVGIDGTIVATYSTPHAFLFAGLNDLYATMTVDLTALTFSGGSGGLTSGNSLTFYQDTDVPLPAAAWLMLGGLGGLAALRRSRRA